MSKLMFRIRTGRWPKQDDLERVNCKQAGEIGHGNCGWCNEHRAPMYQCMCASVKKYGGRVIRIA